MEMRDITKQGAYSLCFLFVYIFVVNLNFICTKNKEQSSLNEVSIAFLIWLFVHLEGMSGR